MSPSQTKGRSEFGPLFSKLYSVFSSILPSSRRFYSLIVEDIGVVPEGRILDVGCGTGNLITLLAEKNPSARIYGIDPSPGMIGAAVKRTGKHAMKDAVSVGIGDCLSVPFQGPFDLIVSSSSYHHWEDQKSCLSHLAELLSSTGVLSIYERYSGEDRKNLTSKETHSLSHREAETMNLDSCDRDIRVIGQVICVRFRKRAPKKETGVKQDQ